MRVARPNEQQIKPAFTVRQLEGKRKETRITYHDGKRTVQEVEVPAGFMVQMLNGNSIRVATQAELDRMNFGEDATVELINPARPDDEPIGVIKNTIERAR